MTSSEAAAPPARFSLLVTGAPYGSEASASALLFARALLAQGHLLQSVFFYQEGVLNGNALVHPASDEVNLVSGWAELAGQYGVPLYLCVAAALRRGVVDNTEQAQQRLPAANLHPAFTLAGLGELAQAALTSDRFIQF